MAINDDFILEETEPAQNEGIPEGIRQIATEDKNDDDINGVRKRNDVTNDLPLMLQ